MNNEERQRQNYELQFQRTKNVVKARKESYQKGFWEIIFPHKTLLIRSTHFFKRSPILFHKNPFFIVLFFLNFDCRSVIFWRKKKQNEIIK